MEQNVESLILAAQEGDVQTVKTLLDAGGVDVDAKGNAGMTALMHASRQNHIECVKVLLNKGANVNATNDFGRTAIKIANEKRNIEIVKLLEGTGATPVRKLRRIEEIVESGAMMKSVIGFDPQRCEYSTKFPQDNEIVVFCPKCKAPHEIANPAFGLIDDKLKIIDIKIYRQPGLDFGVVFGVIYEGISMLSGAGFRVGCLQCNTCQKKIFLAFNQNGTRLLKET